VFKEIINDFTNAEYNWSQNGLMSFPTAKNSVSGKIFIFIGCIAGLIIIGNLIFFLRDLLWNAWFPLKEHSSNTFPAMLSVALGLPIGGTVGKVIHFTISSGIKACRKSSPQIPAQPQSSVSSAPPPIPSDEQESSKIIKFTCPKCDQHIEAPADLIGSIVSCPTCNQNIHIGKSAGHNQPSPIMRDSKRPPPIP